MTRKHYVYPDGYRLDVRGCAINYYVNPEPTSFELIKAQIREGMVVWDIGACIGLYTVTFSKLVGPSGMVYAFEPELNNFKKLVTNLHDNNCTNVWALNVAVGDITQDKDLLISTRANGLHSMIMSEETEGSQIVRQIRLDDELFKFPNFIKMDIEGSELKALHGMEILIRDAKNLRLLIEFQPDYQIEACGSQSVLLDWLWAHKFILVGQYEKNLFLVKYAT